MNLTNLFTRNELRRVPAGTVLFSEGEPPDGVSILHAGVVDIVCGCRRGTTQRIRTARAGEILGLSAVVSGRPHDCTATTRSLCEVGSIGTDEFLRMLDENPNVWFSVLKMMSEQVHETWETVRKLA